MKLIVFLMLFTFIGVFASESYSQTTLLSVKANNISLEDFLNKIEDQSEFRFFYSGKIDVEKKVSGEFNNKIITEIIDAISDEAGIKYELKGRHIILFAKDDVDSNSEQAKTISGKIADVNGDPIPGASIVIKGTTTGTISAADGTFTLNIPESAETLQISFVGMKTQEIVIENKTNFSIVLTDEGINVDEVVVTALGLSRESKSLGYAVQSVDGEQFVESKELNVVNALAGRVSGVHITQGGGGLAGGGSRIVIRGETSLDGNNQPMFVIDGIPAGSNDIASEDIETISVLKGPAAAALYGSRAGAGVILITTKNGPKNGRLNIDINSSMSFQNPMVLPDVQDQYGQGSGGNYMSNRDKSWGPKFDGQNVEQLWGSDVWNSHPDNVKDFYETGTVATNNISLAGDNETGMFRVSFTDIRQNGMIPNTEYRENRIDITSGWTFMDGLLNIKANVKYANKFSDNDKGMDPRLWPTNLDLDVLKDYWIEEGVQQRQWKEQSNNPYFSLYENTNSWQNEKYIGNLTLDFKLTEELSLMLRSGYNGYVNENRYKEQYTTEGANNAYGMFSTGMSKGYEMNSDFLLSYKKNFDNNLSMVASFGGNMMETDGSYINGSSSQLLIPNVYNLANYRTYPTVGNGYDLHKKTNALYGFVNLGYKDMVYLDITARNDWNSTLKYKVNDSYFYPSASLSLLLNKMFNMNEKIDMLKVKMNYAGVGNATSAFQLDPFFNFTKGSGGVANIQEGSVKNNSDLKSEYSNSFEFGAQTILFNSRLDVDVTYYNVKTKNQIWRMDVSSISGYNQIMRNIGKVGSKGVEVTINATPVKSGKFQWNTSVNWSLDRTKVLELDEENPEYAITRGIASHLYAYDFVGERRGAIYSRVARKFEFDAEVHDASLKQYDGQLFFDGSKDLPRSDKEIIGYYNPDWIGSWYNEFKYGNLSVSALLFANVGNSVYNGFEKSMVGAGMDKRTVEGREGGILPEGVWESPDGIRPFLPGDEVNPESYWGDFMTDGEINDIWIEDGSFLKLKEVNIGYSVPKKLIKNTLFKDVKVSVTGRNLALWTKVKHVDPETFSGSSAGTVTGIVQVGNVPSARTFTLNLRLRF